MEELADGQILYRIHGAVPESEDVSASVFSSQLRTLLSALRAADRAINGKERYDYTIAKLRSSAPTIILAQRMRPKFHDAFSTSAIGAFNDCAIAVAAGNRERAQRYGDCPRLLGKLAKGSGRSFDYAEIWTNERPPTRVDTFLSERAETIGGPTAVMSQLQMRAPQWFEGVAFGSFDGTIALADVRGALPRVTLLLSAGGGKLIECVCREDHIEQVRQSLKRRVRVYGKAIYDGTSGLPRRVMVARIDPIPHPEDRANFAVWKGAFEPFEPSDWDGDDA